MVNSDSSNQQNIVFMPVQYPIDPNYGFIPQFYPQYVSESNYEYNVYPNTLTKQSVVYQQN